MKKVIAALSVALLLEAGATYGSPVKASTLTEDQAQLTKADEQIKKIEQALVDNANMMNQTQGKIISTQSDLNNLQQKIGILEKRINGRNKVIKERMHSIQENRGTVSYLDVLLGAKDFDDFISRATAVTTIVNADQELISQNEQDLQTENQVKQDIEKKLGELNQNKTELEGMQEEINQQKEASNQLKQQLLVQQQQDEQEAEIQQQQQAQAEKEATVQAQTQTPVQTEDKNANSLSNSPVISNNTVSLPQVTHANGSSSTAINAGYKYIGNSVYVFGAGRTQSDIQNGRFDCSGFVHWAFSQAGINVGTSTDALASEGTAVPVSAMQPGDLVFFDTYKKDGHVGIYMGGGNFIGSQSSTGVAIVNMSNVYWKQHFSGHVVRIR